MELNYNIENIYYIRKGKGKKVLLLHGWQSNSNSFKIVFEYLIKNFDVIAIDFPGFGNSPNPPLDWGIYEYANIVYNFIKYHNFYPCSLIGHSFGGRVALILGSNFPEIIDKIILVDSAGIKPKRKIKYYYKIYRYKILKYFTKFYCKFFNKDFESLILRVKQKLKIKGSLDYENSKELKNIFIKVVNQDLSKEAKKITKPTLIVWGENDKETPLYMAKKLNKYIKDSGIVLLENAGHYSFLEQFNKFISAVNYFLSLD
ncbi:MAG: alpha/beta hydrolase [Spirochaetales bacterium]|nr:alpha/beta hydrolase [Spirochaetales bacterium]